LLADFEGKACAVNLPMVAEQWKTRPKTTLNPAVKNFLVDTSFSGSMRYGSVVFP
jgi:hypothetical protein